MRIAKYSSRKISRPNMDKALTRIIEELETLAARCNGSGVRSHINEAASHLNTAAFLNSRELPADVKTGREWCPPRCQCDKCYAVRAYGQMGSVTRSP